MTKHDYALTPEEQQILQDVEAGKYVSVPNLEERKKEIQAIAAHHNKKTKNINIRVTAQTYNNLKTLAQTEGIPYQTYLNSLITLGLKRRKKILEIESEINY